MTLSGNDAEGMVAAAVMNPTAADEQLLNTVSLWLDGPATLVAVVIALIGAHFAIKFLRKANLQRELTAGPFSIESHKHNKIK